MAEKRIKVQFSDHGQVNGVILGYQAARAAVYRFEGHGHTVAWLRDFLDGFTCGWGHAVKTIEVTEKAVRSEAAKPPRAAALYP